jgi:redox-sensitive bicupin YhaK (pirin superfamily)
MMRAPVSHRVEVHRAGDRLKTKVAWLDSRHSFAFGQHYDPGNTHHGVLLVHNEDVVHPGEGFDPHPHRNMEIVTWVLEGSLLHQDSMGNSGVIYPGLAQRMSAGTGIMHSERNDAWKLSGTRHQDPVHFIQMWVLPDESDTEPGYEQAEVDDRLRSGGWVPVASGMPRHRDETAIRIRNKNAAMQVARIQPGGSVLLPDAPYVHLFVARGMADLETVGLLDAGDAARLTHAGGLRVGSPIGAEIVVWEMHSRLGE